MNKILIVIDMQNDFITGSLANPYAEKIIKNINDKIKKAENENKIIIFTRDIHHNNYFETLEGKKLPIKHCVENTYGCEIDKRIYIPKNAFIKNKLTFGDFTLPTFIFQNKDDNSVEEIEIIGICTGICVISNAMILKSFFMNVPIIVDSKCCACVSKESHETALNAMRNCQIDII